MRNKSIVQHTLLFGCINILLMLGPVSTDGQIGCPNLIVNGDFQAGNTGFTSGLALSCVPADCEVESYCVGNEFRSKCNSWPDDFWDHTLMNSSGSFMSIDGSLNLNLAVDVWSTTVNVTNGVTYEFGFWAASVYNASDQQFDLGFVINSTLQSPTAFISQSPPAWTYYSTIWVSNVTGTIPIAIRQMTAGAFRDFGLDDIRFSCLSCHPDFVAVPEPCGIVQFINQSLGQLPATFFWDFDDPNSGANNTSTLDNPSHQFSTCGSFNVCLTIIAANGCIETICKPVTPTAESVPPVALCQPGQGYDLLANCTLPLTVAMIDAGSFDNCQVQSMVVSPAVIQGCGVFPVTLTVTDWCGNVSVCNTEVQTIESESPTISCPQAVTVTASAPDCIIAVQNIQTLGANDNCSTPTVTYTTVPTTTGGTSTSDASGSVFGVGISLVTYTATDDCGNMASCSFEVTVQCDSCCDLAAFCLAIENATTITLEEDSCKATLSIGNLPCNDYLEWVDWGDGQQDFGPYGTGDMPMHTYTGGGTYHISYLAIALDPATGFICLEKVLTDTVTLNCAPVGLQETLATLSLRVYPNPAADLFTLELSEPATPGMSIRLTNLTGQVMRSLPVEAGTPRQELDAGNLPAGLYFVQVWSQGKLTGTTKLVKQ